MTRAQFVDQVLDYRAANPEQRLGQAYFNYLWILAPHIANEIRGSEFDPFYNDMKIERMLAWMNDYFEEN